MHSALPEVPIGRFTLARKTSTKSRNQKGTNGSATKLRASDDDASQPAKPTDEAAATDDEQELAESTQLSDQHTRDEAVARATRGLIRFESRRRARTFVRRLFRLIILVAAIGGIGYYAADYFPAAQMQHYWQELKSKLPVFQNQPSPEPEIRVQQ